MLYLNRFRFGSGERETSLGVSKVSENLEVVKDFTAEPY